MNSFSVRGVPKSVLTLIGLLAVVVMALGATAKAGPIVADSGFKVEPNGFSFQNYGNEEKYQNLDSGQMRRLFGNAVCLSGSGSKCVLTPTARSWMEDRNEAMAGGHCYGFAVLAWAIQRGQLPRYGYNSLAPLGGGTSAFDLKIESNRILQSAIARAWAFQSLPSVDKGTITGTPTRILKVLLKDLNPDNSETYTMGIFQPGFEGGHAITPTSVEDLGEGKFGVHVYDNNWPGDSNRVLTVDTVADTWSYVAATNPSQPGSLYEGNAKTETLRLMPTKPGYGIQDCFLCLGRRGAASKYNEVTLSNPGDEHAHLLITDGAGRSTGYINGHLVNRIPGAKVLPRSAGGPEISVTGVLINPANSLEPDYLIPKNLALRIKVDGSNLSYNDRESVSVVGTTFDSSVDNLRVGPGRNAHLTLSPKKKTLSFTGSKVRSTPTVSFGAESERAAYRIKVRAPGASPGRSFFFAKKPNLGLLRIGSKTSSRQRYRIVVTRYTVKGLVDFGRSYSIRGKQQAYLYYGPLASPTGIAKIAIGEPGKKKVRILKLKRLP